MNTEGSLGSISGKLKLAAATFASRFRQPQYRVEYGITDEDTGIPLKVIYKGNRVIAATPTFEEYAPREFVDSVELPPFAQGRCTRVGEGDYKIVYADQDGNSPQVIKRYGVGHSYYPEFYRKDRDVVAADVAEQISEVNEVFKKKFGASAILPSEMRVDTYSVGHPEIISVFEIQQRALLTSPWLVLDPMGAEKAQKDIQRIYRGEEDFVAKLGRKGIKGNISFNVAWDSITQAAVAYDIVDYISSVRV